MADRVFVGVVFVATAAAALWFLVHFGRNVPFMEDWEFVPVYSGHRTFSIDWLFEQLLEHRYVLSKAVLYGVWLLTHDFRGGMLLDLVCVSAIAAIFIVAARKLRGRTTFTDAFFPVVFLHFGHYENLIFSSQFVYVAPLTLFAIAILMISLNAWQSTRGAIVFGVVLSLFPLNGGVGLLLGAPLVLWTVVAAAARRSETGDVRTPSILAGAAAVWVVSSLLYFVHFQRLTQPGTIRKSITTVGRTALQVFSIALGPQGRDLWPWSAALGIAAIVGAAVVLAVAITREPDRLRTAGLFACLAATTLLPIAIGYGRAQVIDSAGFPSHYAWFAAYALCCAYLAYAGFGNPFVRRLVPTLIFGAALAMYGAGAREGLDYGKSLAAADEALLADVASGMPPEAVAQRHVPQIYPNPEPMAERLAMLRDGGIGPYRALGPDSVVGNALREVTIPISILALNQARVENDVIRGTGTDPYVILALPQPTYVVGVRFDYVVTNEAGAPPQSQAFWSLTGTNEFDAVERNAELTAVTESQPANVWVFDTIDRLRLDPDVRPCTLTLRSVTLLVPK